MTFETLGFFRMNLWVYKVMTFHVDDTDYNPEDRLELSSPTCR